MSPARLLRPGRRVDPARIRAVGRWAVLPFVIAVFAINSIGGPSHGSVSRPPASDAEIEAFVADQVRDTGIPGAAVAIVRDGRVSDARGFGVADDAGRPVTAITPFVIGSLSKPITATAVLQLVEAGRIRLDDPVRVHLPEFGLADPGAADAITIRQLLDQTSGLPTSAGQRPLNGPVSDLGLQVRALADVRPAAAPGAAYAYSNANYLVLGRLVEVVSGEPFATYVQEHVFGVLGMTHASADRPTAVRNGLGAAHRLWFGIARDGRATRPPGPRAGRLPGRERRRPRPIHRQPGRWRQPRRTADPERGVGRRDAARRRGDGPWRSRPLRPRLGRRRDRRGPDGRPRRQHDRHGVRRVLLARAAVRRRHPVEWPEHALRARSTSRT